MQAKLLRVLQEREFERVGGTHPIRVDIRLIAATNRDLTELVRSKKFREDLYYRLKVVTVELPPLREKLSDLPLLFDFFLKKYSVRSEKTLAVNPEVFSYLENYSWPGNVRQLENVVERAVALNTSGVFDVEDLPEEIQSVRRTATRRRDTPWATLEEMEERYIREVLEGTNGNISRAAEILGIDRRTLYRKLEKPVNSES
jgi:transcriptional regulator with PAS, ATPase and Fis domain